MTTKEIIDKTLEVMNDQDWYLSDYQISKMRDKATLQYVTMLSWLLLLIMQQ